MIRWIEGTGTKKTISDERLQELMAKVTPLIMKDGELRKFRPVDLRTQSFLWEPDFFGAPIMEASFDHARCVNVDFPCGYYGMFKPSVAEVLAWLPEDSESEINAFYLHDTIDIYKSGEFQRCLVYFGKIAAKYRRGPSKPKSRKPILTSLQRTDEQMVNFLKDVGMVVTATSNERFLLWEKWHHRKDGPQIVWKDNSFGLMDHIGDIADRPVWISLNTAVVGGKKILFVDGTSQLVDHALIDRWIADNLPDAEKTNATNFHCVVH